MMLDSFVKVVLIACGSFNPITRVHMNMFRLAKKHINSSAKNAQVQGIVSPVADAYFLKKGQLVSAQTRIEMIKLALEEFRQEERLEENYVRVDDWESRQAEWSNTLSVLDHFDRQFNGNKSLNRQEEQTQIRLLCGADLIMSMKDANIWPVESVRSIATKYGFIVINRFSIDLREVIDSSEILTEIKRHIEIVDHHQHPSSFDSSTKARETIQAGTRPDDILYSSVCDYIEKNGLYIKKKNAS